MNKLKITRPVFFPTGSFLNEVKNYQTGFSSEGLFLNKIKITGKWLLRVCNGTWVFMEHVLVLCVCLSTAYGSTQEHQKYNITFQHVTHFITQTHHTNPNRDVPNEFCVLRNKSLSRERNQPTVLFIRANMAEEEVAALVVDIGGGTCKAGFAGDDALRVF